jgi:hypothetical protein
MEQLRPMAEQDRPPSSERPSRAVLVIRYGIPAAFIVAGFVILVLTGDAVSWAGFTGAGLAILLIGLLVQIGNVGDRERDREEAARAYFEEHGRWPDEDAKATGRRWRLPENVATPESEAAARRRRES